MITASVSFIQRVVRLCDVWESRLDPESFELWLRNDAETIDPNGDSEPQISQALIHLLT